MNRILSRWCGNVPIGFLTDFAILANLKDCIGRAMSQAQFSPKNNGEPRPRHVVSWNTYPVAEPLPAHSHIKFSQI